MKLLLQETYVDITSVDNLLDAWREFVTGKRNRHDVYEFSLDLIDHIVQLHHDLATGQYEHGGYHAFNVSDPKPRNIHKASVRDRLVHHAVYRKLYPFFHCTFISDSYSCQVNKGTHRALDRFRSYAHEVSKNHTCTCWVLKCDVRKFFASIDHAILKRILASYIHDRDVRILLENIIHSFHATSGVGLPLGNLTSQLFANVYLNEFDQFVKHQLKAAHYIRYCDDFVLLSANKTWLETCIPRIHRFMNERLRLTLHPPKVSITTVASGVDFLGWVHFSDHRIPRTTTKRRMLARMTEYPESATYTSYAGLLKHGNTQKLHNELTRRYICNQGDS